MPVDPQKPVTRADIEAKLAQIKGVTDDTTEVAEGAAKTGLVVAGIGVVVVRVPPRSPARAQEEHHRRSAPDLTQMARRSDAFIAVGAAASAARVIRKDFTSRIVARVGSTALRKGMHSGNRAWFYVAAGRDRLPPAAQVRRAHGGHPHGQAQAGRATRDPRDPAHEVGR